LVQKNENGKYRLGVKLIELGYAAMDQLDLCKEADQELRNLATATCLTVNLATLDEDEIIYIQKITDTASFALNIRIGQRKSAYCRALGKVLLAYLEPHDLQKRIQGPLKALTPKTIVDPAMLMRHLSIVKEQGYAIDDEEAQVDCICIAAPIWNSQRKVVAAVSISGTANEIRSKRMDHWIQLVKSCGQAISAKLGYQG
jgi:IclR family KDG regulon transcriptional repressor